MERRFMSVSLKSKLRFSLLKLRSGGSSGDWDMRWEERLQDRNLQPWRWIDWEKKVEGKGRAGADRYRREFYNINVDMEDGLWVQNTVDAGEISNWGRANRNIHIVYLCNNSYVDFSSSGNDEPLIGIFSSHWSRSSCWLQSPCICTCV